MARPSTPRHEAGRRLVLACGHGYRPKSLAFPSFSSFGFMRIRLERWPAPFMFLAAFMVAAFALGGSARDDVLSLVALRPLSVAFLALGLAVIPRAAWRENRCLIAIALALPLLVILHLIPLPPDLWKLLPGRDLIWRIGEVAGIQQPWRPLSLVPYRTWNAFWALFAPLAALTLALALSREQAVKLVYLIAIIILASGMLGLLQSIGAPGNGFYLYRVTNAESSVGFFANRNHQAMLLAIAFPVIAAAASLSKGSREAAKPKLWLAVGLGVMILPFLLVTGSRAGVALGLVGIASVPWVYRDPSARLQPRRMTMKNSYHWVAIGVVATSLILTMVLVGRMSALQRMFAVNAGDDLRFRVWGPIMDAVWTYFPFGSGIGTFVEVYKVVEPDNQLSPQYLNHAHNDWLEILLTGGLPAVAIIAAALWIFVRAAVRLQFDSGGRELEETVLVRLGAVIILILCLGSLYDYPLRVPSLACLFAVASVWLVARPSTPERSLRQSQKYL